MPPFHLQLPEFGCSPPPRQLVPFARIFGENAQLFLRSTGTLCAAYTRPIRDVHDLTHILYAHATSACLFYMPLLHTYSTRLFCTSLSHASYVCAFYMRILYSLYTHCMKHPVVAVCSPSMKRHFVTALRKCPPRKGRYVKVSPTSSPCLVKG